MHPAVRALGNLLRLVGISSPEDTEPHRDAPPRPAAPPSWRSSAAPAPPPATSPSAPIASQPAKPSQTTPEPGFHRFSR
jgi:hypothetical protein